VLVLLLLILVIARSSVVCSGLVLLNTIHGPKIYIHQAAAVLSVIYRLSRSINSNYCSLDIGTQVLLHGSSKIQIILIQVILVL